MDLDSRFKPSSGHGGRIILLGDGTEDSDLVSQVDKYNKDEPNGKAPQVTESPSSVHTEKSDSPESSLKEAQGNKKPVADVVQLK
jgi:protein phosphatase 2C family protein 2/3